MKNYTLIEHTADIGMIVRGNNLKRLFQNAATAMFDIIAQKHFFSFFHPKPQHFQINLSADDSEMLLVSWLGELLALSVTKNLIFYKFSIFRLDAENIEAEVVGRSSAVYRLKTEVKAVTYSDAQLSHDEKGWQAQIIFDV